MYVRRTFVGMMYSVTLKESWPVRVDTRLGTAGTLEEGRDIALLHAHTIGRGVGLTYTDQVVLYKRDGSPIGVIDIEALGI